MMVKEYKLSIMSKFWVANEQHGDYNNIVLNTWKSLRVNIKCYNHQKKNGCEGMVVLTNGIIIILQHIHLSNYTVTLNLHVVC